MARGMPAFWTTLVALPFLSGGAYVHLYMPEYPTSTGTIPLFFGVFMVLIGLYVHFMITPPPPEMQPGEILHLEVSPFNLAAINRFPFFLIFFVVTIYLRFQTELPVVYPAASMSVALYFLTTGLIEYWKSTLTVHYVTNRRIITDYRFLWLSRVDVPLQQIKGLEQRKSIVDSLLGVGNVILVTGAGGRRPARIEMWNVRDAINIRMQIASLRFAHDGVVDEPEDLREKPSVYERLSTPLARTDDKHGNQKAIDPGTVSGPDQPAPGVPVDTDGRDSRSYTVDADLNIYLPGCNDEESSVDSNTGAATTLVGQAASTAKQLRSVAHVMGTAGITTQLTAAYRAASTLEALIDDEESTIDSDPSENFEWIEKQS